MGIGRKKGVGLVTILLVLSFLSWKAYSSISDPDPLLFFASSGLEKKFIQYTTPAHYLPEKKVIIIETEGNAKNSYSSIVQLFDFIAVNSEIPAKGNSLPWQPLEKNCDILFHSSDPLTLTCGKISVFFARFLTEYMDVSPQNIRLVDMWSKKSFAEKSMTEGYLRGGHELLEIYFNEFNKWIAFDPYHGIIPHHKGTPLSLYEISQLDKDNIDFHPRGKDLYSKGPDHKERVDLYYKDARRIFGYRGGNNLWHILFLHPRDRVPVFQKNFRNSYKSNLRIYTDPEGFSSLISRSPEKL